MPEAKKTGKIILRSVDGQKAAGFCAFNMGKSGIEATVSAQLFSGGQATAVLQFGPERGYLCRPPVDITSPVRCGEPGVMAVWVLDGGKPALFGQLVPGAFDRDAARCRLGSSLIGKRAETDEPIIKTAALPAAATDGHEPGSSTREPSGEDDEVPFQSLLRQAGEGTPLLLLQPADVDEAIPPVIPTSIAPSIRDAIPEREKPLPERDSMEPSSIQKAPSVKAPQQPGPAREQKAPAQPWSPLIVKRAPRPAPREPVYSPLWDDISSELQKMLESLPSAHPFGDGGVGAEFVEVPTDGAVQCYVGSATINGLKVFLQAVPARPYARPAGFDHTLVSRSGECYWVKYFIQDS